MKIAAIFELDCKIKNNRPDSGHKFERLCSVIFDTNHVNIDTSAYLRR
jgi:hypothetical protein